MDVCWFRIFEASVKLWLGCWKQKVLSLWYSSGETRAYTQTTCSASQKLNHYSATAPNNNKECLSNIMWNVHHRQYSLNGPECKWPWNLEYWSSIVQRLHTMYNGHNHNSLFFVEVDRWQTDARMDNTRTGFCLTLWHKTSNNVCFVFS